MSAAFVVAVVCGVLAFVAMGVSISLWTRASAERPAGFLLAGLAASALFVAAVVAAVVAVVELVVGALS